MAANADPEDEAFGIEYRPGPFNAPRRACGRRESRSNANQSDMASYYKGMEFRTKLLAHWAAFFDLAGWTWHANPAPVGDWLPDFLVSFPCPHSECSGQHSLLVSVLSTADIESNTGHPALQHRYRVVEDACASRADAGALFGVNPTVSRWQMAHGAGGGIDDVVSWVSDSANLWSYAGQLVRT
nr:hypothetical protein [Cupriavidus gilardii]